MELRFFIDTNTDAMDKLTVIEKNQDADNLYYVSCDIEAKHVCLIGIFDNIDQLNNYLADCVELPTALINKDLVQKMIERFTEV